jgi:hypothetical protein
VLRLEEMELEIPMGRNAQISLADDGEDSRLRNRVGIEVVKFHLIANRQRSQESTPRNP